jgi:hypothetical protein
LLGWSAKYYARVEDEKYLADLVLGEGVIVVPLLYLQALDLLPQHLKQNSQK